MYKLIVVVINQKEHVSPSLSWYRKMVNFSVNYGLITKHSPSSGVVGFLASYMRPT